MGEEYNFTSIQLRYNDVNGMYEIALSFSSFEKLSYQKLLDKTKKDTRPSLDYTEWLEKQNKND
jgi:hypothetical protein